MDARVKPGLDEGRGLATGVSIASGGRWLSVAKAAHIKYLISQGGA